MIEEPVLTSVDEVHVHPAKTGHRLVDLSIALSAIAISLISLFVAVEHGRTERQLVQANSWPFIEVGYDESGDEAAGNAFRWKISNKGVGPAQLESLQVDLDGKPLHNYSDLFAVCCGVTDLTGDSIVRHGLIQSSEPIGVLAAGDEVQLMAWRQKAGDAALWTRMRPALRRLQFRACYCSVLDECWTSDPGARTRPKPVALCTASDREFRPTL